MALGHRRPWKIKIHGKICNICIKLKATVKPPSWKFQRLLKLNKLLTGVDSKSESRILVQQRRTLKSRILSFVKNHLGRRRSKTDTKTSIRFKMPDSLGLPCLDLETEIRSWHLSRVELSCVAAFDVGLGYLLAELGPRFKRNVLIKPSSLSSFILVFLILIVSWLHKSKQWQWE